MKKVLLLTGALMLVASAAFAASAINMHWDDCTLGAPATDKIDACLANFGPPNKLVLSVGGADIITNVNGAQGVIDIQTTAAVLPDFWRLDAAGCRQGKLAADVGVGSSNAPFSCPEPWTQIGQTAGGAAFLNGVNGVDRGRIVWIIAVPGVVTIDGTNVAPDWYIIAINLLKANSTTCAGCLTPACLVANEIRLTKPAGTPGGDVFMFGPASNQHVTWQGGGGLQCPAATPTQSQTWGQVKSLYR
jgi:hypothetical protein